MTVLRVGHTPDRFSATATYFNGSRSSAATVALTIDEDTQSLVGLVQDGTEIHWPLTDIRQAPDQAGGDQMVLQLCDDPVQRLVLSDFELAQRLPNRKKRPKITKRGPLIGWAMAAVASVGLIIFVLVPAMANQLARFIPPEGERALGEVTLQQIRTALDQTGLNPVPVCSSPEGLAAREKMEERLQSALPETQSLHVSILDHEMINAFALPGNYIVFFRGLIEKAETPDEVAAVFAHEIGHVVSRDPTRHTLRSAGSLGVLGLLFGDFAGGAAVLLLAERLIEAQYSQEAEADADVFAHSVLVDAKIAPEALATMFERFRDMGGEASPFVAHFLSHPSLGDRIQAARDATPPGFEALPILSAQEWRALQNICD
ncbi:M48 family metallopeptidase [Marivita sp. XM-24bin2]|uniref:M48 family metallopeptidase n=1 Tax=Marivita sp. XM-24bin2 TaxID=2133951 RepID=UPI000D796D07|nr:M48 family metallopeptidase [Marivita sp. XM-24bin2]PWL37208.1 MAG: peptidase M48 Ste24p [Marivita sp. XM-24bin2]